MRLQVEHRDDLVCRHEIAPSAVPALIHHHGADGFSFVHQIERVVDAFEREFVGDEVVDGDSPLHGPIDDFWNIGAASCAAERRALPDAAGDELERPRRDLLTGAGNANVQKVDAKSVWTIDDNNSVSASLQYNHELKYAYYMLSKTQANANYFQNYDTTLLTPTDTNYWRLHTNPFDSYLVSMDGEFRLADRVWARVVFDFLLAYRARVMYRSHIAQSLAPLYLGCTASLVLETRGRPDTAVAQATERLARAFEDEKPYLVDRWR